MQKLFKLPAKFLQSPPMTLDKMPVEEEFENNLDEDIGAGKWMAQQENNLLEEKENS